MATISSDVLDYLADATGPRTSAEVAEALGLSKSQASSALSKLVKSGSLLRLADGTGCVIAVTEPEVEAEVVEAEVVEAEVVEAEVVEADDDLLGAPPAGSAGSADPMTKTAVYAAMKSIREALRDAERAVERGDTRVAFEGIHLAANRSHHLDNNSRLAGIKGL